MEFFFYDLVYPDRGVIEINELFAPDLEGALCFLDGLFLDLHADSVDRPAHIRLRRKDVEEPLADYRMHFDIVA
jgi:hypothetical protein